MPEIVVPYRLHISQLALSVWQLGSTYFFFLFILVYSLLCGVAIWYSGIYWTNYYIWYFTSGDP
jgi:hypothetical protein